MINLSQYRQLREIVREKIAKKESLQGNELLFLKKYPFLEDDVLTSMTQTYERADPFDISYSKNNPVYALYFPWLLEHAVTTDQKTKALQYLKNAHNNNELWIPEIVIEDIQNQGSPWYLQRSDFFVQLLKYDERILAVDTTWKIIPKLKKDVEAFYTLSNCIIKRPEMFARLLEKSMKDDNPIYANKLYEIIQYQLSSIKSWKLDQLRSVESVLKNIYHIEEKKEHIEWYAKIYNLILPTSHSLALPLYELCEKHHLCVDLHENMNFRYPNIIEIIDIHAKNIDIKIQKIIDTVDMDYMDISNIQWIAAYVGYHGQSYSTSVHSQSIKKHPIWKETYDKVQTLKTLGATLQDVVKSHMEPSVITEVPILV